MEPNDGILVSAVFLYSLVLTLIAYWSIKGIIKRRIKIMGKDYQGWQAIAPSAIILFLGFVPFILFLDSAISILSNSSSMFPVFLLICGAAVIFVIFYSYAIKNKL